MIREIEVQIRFQRSEEKSVCLTQGASALENLLSEGQRKEEGADDGSKSRKVVSTHASTSQADGSDSDSSVFPFSVTTLTVGYSENVE